MVREITIKPVLNGFACKVGCQTVVFGDTETLSRQIKAYYDNPEATEATYLKLAVNKVNDNPAMPEVAPPRVERVMSNDCCENVAPSRR